MQALNIPHDRINVAGGAIANGHPLGATGAMIFGTVLDELERRNLNTALVTLCIGRRHGAPRRSSSGCDLRDAQDRYQQRSRRASALPTIRPPTSRPCAGRHKTALGNAVGLSQFGVNPDQAGARRRHVGSCTGTSRRTSSSTSCKGECVLVEETGECILKAGDCAGWKANAPNGHCIVNRSNAGLCCCSRSARARRASARTIPART
jgi:hypothetical protein